MSKEEHLIDIKHDPDDWDVDPELWQDDTPLDLDPRVRSSGETAPDPDEPSHKWALVRGRLAVGPYGGVGHHHLIDALAPGDRDAYNDAVCGTLDLDPGRVRYRIYALGPVRDEPNRDVERAIAAWVAAGTPAVAPEHGEAA